MKISENTKVKIRVPKRLYEAVQAEMESPSKKLTYDDVKKLRKQYGMNGGYPLDYLFDVSEDLLFNKNVKLAKLKNFIKKVAAGNPATLGSPELDKAAEKLVASIKYLIALGDSPEYVASVGIRKAQEAYDYFDNVGAGAPGTEDDWKEDLQEASVLDVLTKPEVIAPTLTFLGVAGSLIKTLVDDLRNAKTPEEKEAVRQEMANSIQGQMGGNMEEAEEVKEIEEAIDLETLMEAIKDAKKKKAEEKKKKEAEAKKKALKEAEDEVSSIKNQIEILKDELLHTDNENDKKQIRGEIAKLKKALAAKKK